MASEGERAGGGGESGPQQRSSRDLSLTTGGLTLLSVLLSIGVSVGTSISPWWAGVAAGVGTTVGLALAIKLGSKAGRGPLARLANWIINAP